MPHSTQWTILLESSLRWVLLVVPPACWSLTCDFKDFGYLVSNWQLSYEHLYKNINRYINMGGSKMTMRLIDNFLVNFSPKYEKCDKILKCQNVQSWNFCGFCVKIS